MGGGGTISAMNSSLKSNNKMIRRNRLFTKFSMDSNLDYTNVKTLSRKENLLIIEKNKLRLEKASRIKRFVGIILILVLIYLASYVASVYG